MLRLARVRLRAMADQHLHVKTVLLALLSGYTDGCEVAVLVRGEYALSLPRIVRIAHCVRVITTTPNDTLPLAGGSDAVAAGEGKSPVI